MSKRNQWTGWLLRHLFRVGSQTQQVGRAFSGRQWILRRGGVELRLASQATELWVGSRRFRRGGATLLYRSLEGRSAAAEPVLQEAAL